MRGTIVLLAAAALVGLAGCHRAPSSQSATATIPVAGGAGQAPGLWVERVSDRAGTTEIRYCLDQAASTRLAAFDRRLNGRCSRHDMAQAADGSWTFKTNCDMGPLGKVASEGVMTGDFTRDYRVEIESQTVGAQDPALDGPGRLVAQFHHLGACPKSMKGGDVRYANGAAGRLEEITPA